MPLKSSVVRIRRRATRRSHTRAVGSPLDVLQGMAEHIPILRRGNPLVVELDTIGVPLI